MVTAVPSGERAGAAARRGHHRDVGERPRRARRGDHVHRAPRLQSQPEGLQLPVAHLERVEHRGRCHQPRVAAREGQKRRLGALNVAPSGNGPVTLTVNPTTSCEAAERVCTEDGGRLEQGAQARVAGPAALSVADAQASVH